MFQKRLKSVLKMMYQIYYYKQHKPISYVMTNYHKYYGIIESLVKDKLGVVEIELKYVMTFNSLSMHFHHASMDFSIDETEVQMIDITEIQSYILMLLELNNDERHDYLGRKDFYYYIDSNWCEIDRKDNSIFPKSPFCDYR